MRHTSRFKSGVSNILLFALFTTATSAHSPSSTPTSITAPTATIEAGIVVGKTTSLPQGLGPVNLFWGIPFAQTPPERFSPPRAALQFNSPLNATKWEKACVQQFQYPLASSRLTQSIFNNPPPVESEDCLYLNIYAPSGKAGGDGRPVLFWIYGGSLQFGHAGQAAYDGSAFAAYEDVIVVTVNYRTNVFGFPGSPELPLDGRNLGFLDQRFALEWTYRNIHAFGGDPEKITLFGESAGASSIDAILTSYAKDSSPPFRGAILQSGQTSYRASPGGSSPNAWNNLTAELGCPGSHDSALACVRAANATQIQQIINENSLGFSPTPDNVTLVSNGAARRLSGNVTQVPVMIGSNAQESRIFSLGQSNLTLYLQQTFGSRAPELIPAIKEAYKLGSIGIETDYDAISAIATDLSSNASTTALWANATAQGGVPTWRYYFNASFYNTQGFPNLGAYHASEIPLVFRSYNLLPGNGNTTTQQWALAQYMQGVWGRFARNPSAGPGWNHVGTGTEGTILYGANDTMLGGVVFDQNGTTIEGDWDVGVFGDIGAVRGSGVTVLPQTDLDYRCALYRPLFEAALGTATLPS